MSAAKPRQPSEKHRLRGEANALADPPGNGLVNVYANGFMAGAIGDRGKLTTAQLGTVHWCQGDDRGEARDKQLVYVRCRLVSLTIHRFDRQRPAIGGSESRMRRRECGAGSYFLYSRLPQRVSRDIDVNRLAF